MNLSSDDLARLFKQRHAVLIAHYYVEDALQALAEETGGFVGDSLEMARFGAKHPASTLVIAGVKFMGETAKILSPEKTVLMPTLEATCSLDIGCEAHAFADFCNKHPERTVVVYANTSAAVKARADWVVTSSIAEQVVSYLNERGEKILWAPDQHLGRYIQKKTGADMISWAGSCVVHEEFKVEALQQLKAVHPEAAILMHPESPLVALQQADVVGSTSQLLKAARELPHHTLIVGTESGIFYKMQQSVPEKTLIQAPTAGESAACQSCGRCPWMKMNRLDQLASVFDTASHEIHLDPALAQQAWRPLQRMLDFKQETVACP